MRWAYVVFVLGILLCLIGALVMVAGESILGENHTGWAAVIGIVGIGLIGTSGAMLSARATNGPNKKPKPKRSRLFNRKC